jgi:prepilin-type N-terminal cleavage/methylation domain-containing protein
MLKPKATKQAQGFTLTEVLVAILIVVVFAGIAMQAMVVAVAFKVKARQFSEATNWIQQDLENVKQQAQVLGSTTLTSATLSNGSSLAVSSTTGFANGNVLQVSTITSNLYTISGTPSSTSISVTPALPAIPQPADTIVSVVAKDNTTIPRDTLCYATASTNGFGDLLSDNLPAVPSEPNNSSTPNSGTKTITGQTFTLTRIATPGTTAPYNVLQVTYTVARSTTPTIAIATLNTEVIPDAALQCPSF